MSRTPGLPARLCTVAGHAVWLFLLAAQACGQEKVPAANGEEPASAPPRFSRLITLPTADDLQRKLDAAPDYLKAAAWERAIALLQSVLEHPEDGFVRVSRRGADGTEGFQWVSVRGEAARILGTLPPQGLELYQISCGSKAAELLAEGRKRGDLLQVAVVAQRYPYTSAGRAAADLLATHHLDRGRYAAAAHHFARLLARPDADRLAPLTLFKAALAFHRAGDTTGAAAAWKRLAARSPRGLVLDGRVRSPAELKSEVTRPPRAGGEPPPAHEWLAFRGNVARAARAPGIVGSLESRWQQPTTEHRHTRAWVEEALERVASNPSEVVVPGAVPLVTGDRVVFRTRRGVTALDRRTGRLLWEARLNGSLEQLATESAWLPYTPQWVSSYIQAFAHVVLENSTVGTLSTDRRLVFAVEDLAIPPYPHDYGAFYSRNGQGLRFAGAADLTWAVYRSRLVAIELDTGRVVWEAEGDWSREPVQSVHFLGPPLVLGGRLYAVTEQDQTLRLVCLEAATGKGIWSQGLAGPKRNVLIDGARRTWAAHIAQADGVLICPTNAGAVLAVDEATGGLLWAHVYRDEPPPIPLGRRVRGARRVRGPQAPTIEVKWKACAPLIHQGKVLVAAPDGDGLDCVDLWTGALLWRAKYDDCDLYVAGVYRDRALVVGRQRCGAVRLADGKMMWGAETPRVSGQGVLAGKCYYLPVRRCETTGGPALLAVDVATGRIVARTLVPGEEPPGNLVLTDRELLSQTSTRVSAYAVVPSTPPRP